jgi:hypothetical protein
MENGKLNPSGRVLTESEALALLVPGAFLYGYCGGAFGHSSYQDKEIIGIFGKTIVVRIPHGREEAAFIDGDTYTWADLIKDSDSALDYD